MNTNELQATLLSDTELEVKKNRNTLHMHKIWFKNGRIMNDYLNTILELSEKYEKQKEAKSSKT